MFSKHSPHQIFLSYKDRLNRSQQSKVISKASYWHCKDLYTGKTNIRLHDGKTELFKALAKHNHTSAIADHVNATGHNIKCDHFDILASLKKTKDYYYKIKEKLFIQELKPVFNVSVSNEKRIRALLISCFFVLNLSSSPHFTIT